MFVYWFNNVHLSRLVFWHQEVASGPFCFLVNNFLMILDSEKEKRNEQMKIKNKSKNRKLDLLLSCSTGYRLLSQSGPLIRK